MQQPLRGSKHVPEAAREGYARLPDGTLEATVSGDPHQRVLTFVLTRRD